MRPLPNLYNLRAFEATARHLSVSKAADELFITHSAVSQQVKALEAELGISLIDRSGHKIKLTAAGQEYAETLISLFNKLRQANQKIRSHYQNRAIRLSVPNTLGLKFLIPKLNRFYEAHPEIQIDLLIYRDRHGKPDIDIEICYGEPRGIAPEMILIRDALIAVKSPAYSASFSAGTEANSKLRLIQVDAPLRQNDWPRWLAAAKLNCNLEDALTFHETIQALEAVKNAMGILVTYETCVREELASGQLVLAHSARFTTPEVFYLSASESVQALPAFKKIKAWLTHEVFQ